MGSETNVADDDPTDVYGRARALGRPASDQESFSRFGADASLNALHCNLAAQYLFSQDSAALWGDTPDADNMTWPGGFAESSSLPHVNVVAFARYDCVDAPDVFNAYINRATLGVRYDLVYNRALHGEYSYRSVKSVSASTDDVTLSFFTARVDFAF